MEVSKNRNLFIEEVPKQSRPRERLLYFGEKALADHELLAILLRTGTRQENVIELALRLIQEFETLYGLNQASLEELQSVPGIGPIKAIEIKASMEIGLRIATSTIPKYGKITSTKDVGEWLLREMRQFHQEHLTALFLNTKNEIIRRKDIFKGTVNSSVAHPRESAKCSLVKS
ncbi:RadC family protein [Globicatella sanguinis]|uniref:RadC family protein n=1 Tax=Globicatella sanguinis TaxID=13076 RepID=UPI00082605CB|nr:DNA repair protein RadC [Globicatella sanguinis]